MTSTEIAAIATAVITAIGGVIVLVMNTRAKISAAESSSSQHVENDKIEHAAIKTELAEIREAIEALKPKP